VGLLCLLRLDYLYGRADGLISDLAVP
jgi:hypothetical protein